MERKSFDVGTFKLVPRPQFFYNIFSRFVTPYHTLSPRLEAKRFLFGNFKISSQAPIFISHLITSCHTLSLLISPYPLGWKQNDFHLATLKLVSRPLFSYHIISPLVTPYHTLSPTLEAKRFSFGDFKISCQVPIFLSHLITSCHTLSLLIASYPLGLKENHLMLANFKLVPRPLFSYHILSRLVTPYHTLSPRLEAKPFSFGNFKIRSQVPIFLSHLTTLCHSLSHLITAYPLGWKENHLMLAAFKLVPRPQFSYHILSRLVTSYHTLSHLIP